MIDDVSSSPSSPSPEAGRPSETSAAGEKTRAALVQAALDLFGRKGYDATSTRDIAAAARVNIAGIAYHFGGKAGLHLACGEFVASFAAERLETLVVGDSDDDARLDPEAAGELFVQAIMGFARFILAQPEATALARFMVREQMDPTPTFDVLYGALIEPRHRRICRLWARATGEEAESEKVIVTVSALFGQVMFFRIARATALRRLGWAEIDASNVEGIVAVVGETTRAALAARRQGRMGA